MIDIVSQVTKLVNQFERGLIAADEYASELLKVAANAGSEALKTYTFISICDGRVIARQTELSYVDLADAVHCYGCDPEYNEGSPLHGNDCPTDHFLSELNSEGKASIIKDDAMCGQVDVMIGYVNKK